MCQTNLCCKCFKFSDYIQEHHIFPVRFFARKNNRNILFICADCHKEIEKIIPRIRKLTKKEYIDIHKVWLKGEQVKVIEEYRRENYEKFKHYGRGNVDSINAISINGS